MGAFYAGFVRGKKWIGQILHFFMHWHASFFIIAYGEAFQTVAHAATAVNRYAVLSRQDVHSVRLPLNHAFSFGRCE